ncbi:transporter substrate-binding domain-containing protein [Lysinibacter sp. HNR]|uniref:transporter substrate-binding domain-containing protein n=1 Tax=Lysinibacter sp. HNR TaxID=3031408 RepID=UPI0024357996|nr:transporter substrate-binding domain-containing protein [Lysinibacter sp. HNR]WGD36638.1 transporter substrate-binding domain-containing protein [Lysinibacter sp. HNR]
MSFQSVKTAFLVTAIGTVGVLLLSGCSGTDNAASGPLLREGVLQVCSETAYPPFEFTQNGEIVGLDMDIAEEIAADLDAKTEVISTAFEAIESGQALEASQCDIVISGISINEERATKFDFSEPYFDDNLALLVTAGSGITGLSDLAGKTVAVQQATTGEKFAQSEGLNPVALEDGTLAVQQLIGGQADAVINNVASLAFFAKDNADLVVVDRFASEPLGAGVRKGNAELLTSVNSTLQRIEEDGTLTEILTKWVPTTK